MTVTPKLLRKKARSNLQLSMAASQRATVMTDITLAADSIGHYDILRTLNDITMIRYNTDNIDSLSIYGDNFRFFDPFQMSRQKFGPSMLCLALPCPKFLKLAI